MTNGCTRLRENLKPLLIGQILSILLAATGAANDTLHFDCNLSAPALQTGLIYFFLSFSFIFLIRERRDESRSGNQGTNHPRRLHQQQQAEEEKEGGNDDAHHELFTIEMVNDETPITSYENSEGSAGFCFCVQPIARCIFSIQSFIQNFRVTIQGSLKMYFMMALVDLEANYFTVLAFRYTTLTSVSLLDAVSIPSSMFFSRFMLRRTYTLSHFIGALVCFLGISVNVLADINDKEDGDYDDYQDDAQANYDDNVRNDKFPNRRRGDFFALIGGMLFGLSNVLTERAVKDIGGVKEYLAMLGIFGSLIAFAQGIIVDKDAIMEFFTKENDQCTESTAFFILLLCALLGVAAYIGVSYFLSQSEATLLNLSLLTGDFWTVVFTVVFQNILPPSMFWVALALIIVGVIVYELTGNPIVEGDCNDDELDHIRRNGLIRQRDESATAQHLRELEMPDERII